MTVIVIAILVALPIILHFLPMPPDISITGNAMGRQMSETMFEAGVLFLAAQFLLGFFIWKFAGHGSSSAIRRLTGGASAMIIFAVVVVGVEILAFGRVGEKTWAAMYFTPAPVDSLLIQAEAEQFAYYFRYPRADRKLGPMHLDKIDDASENYFGLDRKADPDSRDDISPVLVVPVNSMGIDFEF